VSSRVRLFGQGKNINSAFLDALTVIAVIMSVGTGFYSVYHQVASGNTSIEEQLDVSNDDKITNHKYILEELNENDTNKFKKVLIGEANLSNLGTILKFLTKILYEKYNKKVIVLIDEYDSPLITANQFGYYTCIVDEKLKEALLQLAELPKFLDFAEL